MLRSVMMDAPHLRLCFGHSPGTVNSCDASEGSAGTTVRHPASPILVHFYVHVKSLVEMLMHSFEGIYLK